MKPKETRTFQVGELRVADVDGKRRMQGHAAVFHVLSEDLGGFREKIAPGTFTRSIAEGDVRALWNHDANFVLGRTRSKTLRIAEDERGLVIENDVPATQWASDLMVSIERGDITQMSFGFRTVSDKWEMIDGQAIRTLLDVELYDVSPVTFPAYPQTDVAMRSLEAWRKTEARHGPSIDILRRRLDLEESA